MTYTRKKLCLCVCLYLLGTAGTFAENRTQYGGVVHLRGAVTDGTCAVSTESENKQVYMGQVQSSRFEELGSWADPVAFSLVLVDCTISSEKQVGIMFNGVSDGKDPLVFRAGEGANAAQGVGIGIFSASGELIIPNTRPQQLTSLNGETVTLPFTARYRATSRQVIAGDASSNVFFTLYYP